MNKAMEHLSNLVLMKSLRLGRVGFGYEVSLIVRLCMFSALSEVTNLTKMLLVV